MLKVLEYMIGQENTSHITFSKLANHHYLAELDGKLINTASEIESGALVCTSIFKSIVTGDAITVDEKYGKPYTIIHIIKMIFAGNTLPKVKDKTYGYRRRVKIIPFEKQFLGTNQDRHLEDKLKKEINGIFLWALVGLKRLLETQEFTQSPAIEKANKDYEEEINPLITFLEEECSKGINLRTKKKIFREEYNEWCKGNNCRALSSGPLSKELIALGIIPGKSNTVRYYEGVKLNSNEGAV